MANEEHLAILKQGVGVWNEWRHENFTIKPDLSGCDLSGFDLRDVFLVETDLRKTNLTGADLGRAKIHHALLNEAVFDNANLEEAGLSGIDLRSTIFGSAFLRGANLNCSKLIGVNFSQKNLERASLQGAELNSANLNGTNFTNCDLSLSKVSVANLSKANLSNSNLHGADLRKSDLRGANLAGADLSQAFLHEAQIDEDTLLEQKWLLVWKIVNRIDVGKDFRRFDLKEVNLSRTDLEEVNLSGVDLSEADLTQVNFRGANLSRVKLFKARLHEANFMEADLREADLQNALLPNAKFSGMEFSGMIVVDINGADLRGADLRGAYLFRAQFFRANLQQTNLTGAYLGEADLFRADLAQASLQGANLRRARGLETNFSGANLTGACLEDWAINTRTNFDGIICEYVYLREGQKERRPHCGTFAPGGLAKLVQDSLDTVDLIFNEGVNWKAFTYSFHNTQVENEGTSLTIRSIENKGDGFVLIRVTVPPNADKGKIHGDFIQGYEFAQKALEAQYQARLEDKDKHINQLFELLYQDREKSSEVQKLMAEKPGIQQNFHGNIGNVAGNVEGDQKTIQYNYAPEQTLAEAAAEIQELLAQLQTQGYSPQAAQQQVASDLAKRYQSHPEAKSRLAKWGQYLGDAAANGLIGEAVVMVLKLVAQSAGIPIP